MIPAWRAVTRAAYIAGSLDAHGNPVDTWAAPEQVTVHGWSPGSADATPTEAGRAALVRDLELFAPAGTVCAPRDRWTVDALVYEAVSHGEDYTGGPWPNPVAGVKIRLYRVEG